jgi:Uma2 family endonuclease
MTTLARPNWNVTQLPPAPVRRFSVDEYHRMIQTHVLKENDPVELLEGWIVLKMPRTPPHDVLIDLAADAIRPVLPPEWRLRIQSAITTDDSEPEPDLAVVRGPARRYLLQHPTPAEVAILMEVSASSLDYDRDVKGPIYARAGIAVYWIINLVDARIEVYSDPLAGAYGRREDFSDPATVPIVIAGQKVADVPVRDFPA